MKFAVESWDPSYGVSADPQGLLDAPESVDAAVERPLDQWAPIVPSVAGDPPTITFIDGVQRIDARVWITDPVTGEAHPGVCATVAAGAVRCDTESADLVAAVVERGLYTAARDAAPIVTKHGAYLLRPVADGTPEDLYNGVHNHMTALELALSVELRADSTGPQPGQQALLVFDGPLRGREAAVGVGYIKTHNVQYLQGEAHKVIGDLAPGERTPLFLLGGHFARWSWYLRLPGPVSHPLSGVVRLELPGLGQVGDAVARADLVTSLLPRYASEPHKDSRAPQNLHPIAGLERELRRRLGDPQLMERALRISSASAN